MLACMYVNIMDLLPNPSCLSMSSHIELHFVKRRPSDSSLWFCLSGDVALNPGPMKFGFANCQSIRNKGLVRQKKRSTDMYDTCENLLWGASEFDLLGIHFSVDLENITTYIKLLHKWGS